MYRLDHMNFHLRRLGVEVVFDVGANTGQFANQLRLSGYRGRIVSFEPLSDAHAKLNVAARNDPLWEVASRCAVGARPGSAVINIAANSFSSSLLPMLESHIEAAPRSRYVGQEKVEVVTLDQYIGRAYPDGLSSFALKIDTQGFEAEVLDGLGDKLSACCAVLIEMPLHALYRGAASLLSLYGRLEQKGFRCAGISPGHCHPISRDAIEVDAFFVRYDANSKPRSSEAFQLFTSVPPRMSRWGIDPTTDIGPEYQRECVSSWAAAGFKVITLNPRSEADAIASMDLPLDIVVIEGKGRPTLANFVAEMRKIGADLCGIINADCKMLHYPQTALALRTGASDGVIIAERINMVHGKVPATWVPGGYDMFLFPGKQLEKLDEPRFSIGAPWYDFWLPFALAATGLPVRHLAVPLLTHHQHRWAWTPDKWLENAKLFWRDMRRWRAKNFSELDDDLGAFWNQENLSPEEATAIASRVHRWLYQQTWRPAADDFDLAIPTIVQAFRRESETRWHVEQALASVRGRDNEAERLNKEQEDALRVGVRETETFIPGNGRFSGNLDVISIDGRRFGIHQRDVGCRTVEIRGWMDDRTLLEPAQPYLRLRNGSDSIIARLTLDNRPDVAKALGHRNSFGFSGIVSLVGMSPGLYRTDILQRSRDRLIVWENVMEVEVLDGEGFAVSWREYNEILGGPESETGDEVGV